MVRVADMVALMVGLISARANKMVRVADMVALMVGLISARANEMVRLNLTFGMLLVDLLKNLNVIQMDIAIHFCN
jgi:hypothetical protein